MRLNVVILVALAAIVNGEIENKNWQDYPGGPIRSADEPPKPSSSSASA